MIYILCLDVESCLAAGEQQVQPLRTMNYSFQTFKAVRPKTSTSPTLSPGEQGLRLSMLKIFRDALAHSYRTFIVLEEDALLLKEFPARMSEAVSNPRCGCHLYNDSGCTPGILLLGMTVYQKSILDIYDEEVQSTASPCVNLVYQTYGSFGVVYSSGVIPAIVHWLERENLFPYDWVYPYLAMEGFVVRGLRKPLVIMDLRRKSSVKKRMHEGDPNLIHKRHELHDWEIEKFNRPAHNAQL